VKAGFAAEKASAMLYCAAVHSGQAGGGAICSAFSRLSAGGFRVSANTDFGASEFQFSAKAVSDKRRFCTNWREAE